MRCPEFLTLVEMQPYLAIVALIAAVVIIVTVILVVWFTSILVQNVPPDIPTPVPTPITGDGSAILDEVACDQNPGCIWGISRGYCAIGYTGDLCTELVNNVT